MKSRTHDPSCNFGLMAADGALPCTCGVSPRGLTADQAIRVIALRAAVDTGVGLVSSKILEVAGNYERYIRGES
ncbi:hypothetical protein [Streptomyces sp. NPDC046925]|uniref:hypothetical protein n=1 Tax=Streptomyces sp. NPDC046925 TaxID=3155375 RepID=UPI0033FF8234